ncbi:hypothetical protein LPTSP4_30890 [Leptospira ryugenii]|uniref:Uncharacterized protein n=1 Tax=Leptospira ryugenii TaxID=1917863 RepID=A0A2P2E3U8_9LEPT|nr:hypothetical protein [Leptospira ryugenii]GBF51551.1 hypothetical protein LPTSP4_30890 [Leptospira ryugenii]
MNCNSTLHSFSLAVLFSFLFAQPVLAEVPKAKDLLELEMDKALPLIESLSLEESKELVTQIRAEAKLTYPKIDHFYFLVSHLEEIQAIQKEQARLRSLLWVFALALVLFLGLLAYLMIRQRQAIEQINRLSQPE